MMIPIVYVYDLIIPFKRQKGYMLHAQRIEKAVGSFFSPGELRVVVLIERKNDPITTPDPRLG